MKRIFLIVLDSCGIGEEPDAAEFGDVGSNTLRACAASPEFDMRNLIAYGLGDLDGVDYLPKAAQPKAALARLQERSRGKDTTIGHWEIAGIVSEKPLPTYPNGFPEDVLRPFREQTGRGVLCNKPYSGTEVIKDYGEEHLKTGDLIVYTSGDSVLQIAAHEDVIPLDELYRICEYARTLINGPKITMGRVIARPYVGTCKEDFQRTANRHDYGFMPTGPTALTMLQDAGYDVISVGKTWDLFCGQGFDRTYHNESNMDGMDHVDEVMSQDWRGLCFTNLVDFDAVYGHRRNARGDGEALEAFDERLARVMDAMRPNDLLMVTADHGNDPTYTGTDHTRELVPLLAWSPSMAAHGTDLGLRSTCSDLGATVLDNFGVTGNGEGETFLNLVS